MTRKLITSSKVIALLLATIASGATVATAQQSKVASVTREGDHTVIRCMNGSTLKVYHKRNGKCEMGNWQEWDCSFAIKDRMKQCG